MQVRASAGANLDAAEEELAQCVLLLELPHGRHQVCTLAFAVRTRKTTGWQVYQDARHGRFIRRAVELNALNENHRTIIGVWGLNQTCLEHLQECLKIRVLKY